MRWRSAAHDGRRLRALVSAPRLNQTRGNLGDFPDDLCRDLHRSVAAALGHFSRPAPLSASSTMPASLARKGHQPFAPAAVYAMRTILLVDDDAISLSLRAAILAREGYRVLTATSAQTALALVENPAIRMAILDYRMPEMNGEELAKEMRRRNVRVPIVILSGEVCLPATVVNYTDC